MAEGYLLDLGPKWGGAAGASCRCAAVGEMERCATWGEMRGVRLRRLSGVLLRRNAELALGGGLKKNEGEGPF